MTLSVTPLSLALHAEIKRRAAAWADAIAQAVTEERHRVIARAAADMVVWLRIANQLGWSGNQCLEPIEIGGALAQALAAVDLFGVPETADEWDRCVKSAAATLARVRERADDLPNGGERLRAIRDIAHRLAISHAAWAARNPETDERQAA